MLLQFWAMALKIIGKAELYQMLSIFLGMTQGLFFLAELKRMSILERFKNS